MPMWLCWFNKRVHDNVEDQVQSHLPVSFIPTLSSITKRPEVIKPVADAIWTAVNKLKGLPRFRLRAAPNTNSPEAMSPPQATNRHLQQLKNASRVCSNNGGGFDMFRLYVYSLKLPCRAFFCFKTKTSVYVIDDLLLLLCFLSVGTAAYLGHLLEWSVYS